MRRIVCCAALAAMLASLGGAAAEPQKLPPLHRVVTALDAQGRSVILFDDRNAHRVERPQMNTGSDLIWTTDKSPVDFTATTDRGGVSIGIQPPRNGSAFRIVDIAPITPEIAAKDKMTMMRVVGPEAPVHGLPPRHPLMHRTRSLDYAIILSGEIDMLVDEGEVHLKAGDVAVQQGTNHAWVNRGTEICRIAFVLLDSEEP